MTTVTFKGHTINAVIVKDSFHRRAVQFRNNLINNLGKLGVHDDEIEVPVETLAIKKLPATASWFFEGYHLYVSYKVFKFVDNLYLISKIMELEVNAPLEEETTFDEFIHKFSESVDIEKQRKNARELLGISEDTHDLSVIDKKYKTLAKECHPDMPNGDKKRFQDLNHAHKILKRELQ